MNCQQKSGVFLNISCTNTKVNVCSNCEKDICETHSHTLEISQFCEDCYWERFLLYVERSSDYSDTDTVDNDSAVFIPSNSSSGHRTSESNDGFNDGFGGGGFSGGGAGGSWTEGDMESLTDSNNQDGLLSDGDDTFFYS